MQYAIEFFVEAGNIPCGQKCVICSSEIEQIDNNRIEFPLHWGSVFSALATLLGVLISLNDCLDGLVVKASVSSARGPGFKGPVWLGVYGHAGWKDYMSLAAEVETVTQYSGW